MTCLYMVFCFILQSRAVLNSLFENKGPEWAPKFVQVLDDTGCNPGLVQKIRDEAERLKDEDTQIEPFGI